MRRYDWDMILDRLDGYFRGERYRLVVRRWVESGGRTRFLRQARTGTMRQVVQWAIGREFDSVEWYRYDVHYNGDKADVWARALRDHFNGTDDEFVSLERVSAPGLLPIIIPILDTTRSAPSRCGTNGCLGISPGATVRLKRGLVIRCVERSADGWAGTVEYGRDWSGSQRHAEGRRVWFRPECIVGIVRTASNAGGN
jgi:hypothetical protein